MPLPDFDPGFSTAEMTATFSADATVAALLEFEAALALTLADLGMAPIEAANEVAEACSVPVADPEMVLASTWETGTPLIAVRELVESRLDEAARTWFHHGATSQDAIDSGRMLQAKRGLSHLDRGLLEAASASRSLIEGHRDQAQRSRTFLQDGMPSTFAARVAGWLNTTLDRIVDIRRAGGGLPVQLGGPSGDLASYGEAAPSVVDALATRLGLIAPPVPWHSDRSPI
jgi:3-carboxy-cis,cis-muconate cycloisomerase